MKKFLLLWVLGIAILAGCAQQGLSQSELFDKKQECEGYKEEVTKNYEESKYYVAAMFYSEVKNSCVYRLSTIFLETKPNHIIYDYFTGEPIVSKNDTCRWEDVVNCEEQQRKFNKTLEELRWE
jgi:hypothetical protein